MHLQLRFDDGKILTVDCQFQTVNFGQPEAGSELIAATIANSELSHDEIARVFDVTGQVVDYFSRDQSTEGRQPDWQDEWREATKNTRAVAD